MRAFQPPGTEPKAAAQGPGLRARPLPAMTLETAFFWTSGQDDILRLQQCENCAALLHPPAPICRYCHGRKIRITTVSGLGTIVGCTVNYQKWIEGFDPPYVVAIVAIDEDSRVRLTSNIVGCPPDDVHIGMRVKVHFEPAGNIWLPLFTPANLPDAPPPEDPPYASIRPLVSMDKFEAKVAITGIGMSDIGRRLMRPPLSLTVDACLAAIQDSGLAITDIDGLATYPATTPAPGFSEGGITPLEEALGVYPTWISGGIDTPGPTGAVVNAMLAVASGLCRHVLCYRTVWESTASALARESTKSETRSGARAPGVGGDLAWRYPFGAASAANWIAMLATRYFHDFGADREVLGRVATNARRHASMNPNAIYRDPMTMADYFDARTVSTPFGLFDCDVPCDGAIAVVISAREVADDMARSPILVEAVGTQIRERISWDQGVLTHEPQVMGPAAHLWARTELTVSDVDVAELYDGFTFNCLTWLEALGFCGIGEAPDFIGDGSRLTHGGDLPLNTHGGQLSAGRTHGFGFLHEAVVQLRGDGGERQVEGAQVAVLATGGGTPGGCILLRRQ
jgi:acetyl-CoA acetyltransferase/uncharacterized OB-fold protein